MFISKRKLKDMEDRIEHLEEKMGDMQFSTTVYIAPYSERVQIKDILMCLLDKLGISIKEYYQTKRPYNFILENKEVKND